MTELKRPQLLLLLALSLFCIGVWSLLLGPRFYQPEGVQQVSAAAQAPGAPKQSPSSARVAALLDTNNGLLPARSKTTGCAVAGPLPDRECTPGEVFAAAAPAQICVAGYTKHVRSVSTALRKQVYASYNIAYPPPTGSYELDHLVPLALGGDNSAANLFPEAAAPTPGFKEKDVVEVYLQEQVCAGEIDLAAAQAQIAEDWTVVYALLEQSEISRIKKKYTNWAN